MIIQISQLETQRFQSYRELLQYVLEIAKESLDDLLEENSFTKYQELLQCYQSSPRELRGRVKEVQLRIGKVIYLIKNSCPDSQLRLCLRGFSPRWIQIFANILFIIEPEVINLNASVVRYTWEFLFKTMPTEFNPLNINIQ